MTRPIATMIGLTAILLWSSNVGLIRTVTADFGAIGGAALIYSIATVILFFSIGLPKLSTVPKAYIIGGSVLFVACELCFSLSIGFSQNSRQAIEVAMVNYLWPTFTLIFAIIFNQVKSNWLIVPSFILALLGICWVLGGGEGFNAVQMLNNIQKNPLSYSLALGAVLSWAAYCSFTVKKAKGSNLVTLFFCLATIVLWIKYLTIGGQPLYFTSDNILNLIMAAAALGLGYGVWNIGIIYGNMTILAGASYFTPVLSALFAAMILNTPLSLVFWKGVGMVTLGAILCWMSTSTTKANI
ncbi:aromatic amino acid DMT transporter YddG [Acinetobacter sp. YIM 103518]|uniref:Aromatic amino acid DMT transporter YddG n=2 Tax=Acinetobacter faecalis TaxID=2665161 RepID=A0A6L6GHX2_9GAMM|nr:aromatic amino acid DMT transporter YddG [Acinetobacter faecalis]